MTDNRAEGEQEPDELEEPPEEPPAGEQTEFSDEDDPIDIGEDDLADFNEAVLWGTDWTVETVIAQIRRENIEINPQFQRRDAWSRPAKSRFIESIILGLPIPQVVLAERKDQRGRYLILDGKQRLLSIMQYVGLAEASANNKFGLSGLEVRRDLSRKKFSHLENRPELRNDLDVFLSHTIRAVVIKNWPSMNFLHVVFQRLNTGSLKLSPQELRQAIVPGPFTTRVDEIALDALPIHRLLNRQTADPRMRDTELLVRYLAFKRFLPDYYGRMKEFLDDACVRFNRDWDAVQESVEQEVAIFLEVIGVLEDIFADLGVARKLGSNLFNRSIFDVLAYYASDARIRAAMAADRAAVLGAYDTTIRNEEFQEAVESDTAGIPHTEARLRVWGQQLGRALATDLPIPRLVANAEGQQRLAV